MIKKLKIALLLPLLLLTACLDDDDSLSTYDQFVLDVATIENYLDKNELTAEEDESGLFYIIEEEGEGELPDMEENIYAELKYKVFDIQDTLLGETEDDITDTLKLATTMTGLQIGIPKLKEGGKATFFLPRFIAYPANQVLKYEIEVIKYLTDRDIILDYLEANDIEATEHLSGLFYQITQEGTGDTHPTENSYVKVKYTGKFLNNEVFDETPDDTSYKTYLTNLIEGWKVGIPLMTKGAKATFYIPSGMAYKKNTNSVIPPGSILIFDIELIDFD